MLAYSLHTYIAACSLAGTINQLASLSVITQNAATRYANYK